MTAETRNEKDDLTRLRELAESKESNAILWRTLLMDLAKARHERDEARAMCERLMRIAGEIGIERDRLRDHLLTTMTREAQEMGLYGDKP